MADMTAMTAMTSIQEQLVACVQPYEAVLKRGATVVRRKGTEAGAWSDKMEPLAWLSATNVVQPLMKGLELLALLARADWRLWTQVVTKLWGPRTLRKEDLCAERPVKVGVYLNSYSMWSDDQYELLITSSSSPAFQASKNLMLSVLSHRAQTVDEVPVLVAGFLNDGIEVRLRKISQLVLSQHQSCEVARRAADENEPLYCGLRVRIVDVGDIFEWHTDASVLQAAANIASCGVTFGRVRPPLVTLQEMYPHEFMNTMVQLFPLDNQVEIQDCGGVACVEVRASTTAKAYPAILSAVAASSCVRTMDMLAHLPAMEKDHRRSLWSWMTYSAFRGQHRVQEIFIHAETLEHDAMDTMTPILQAVNPVATLFNSDDSETAPDTVSASRFALLDPSGQRGSEVSKWSCGQTFDNLPVIDRTNDWVSVLLPRWGRAWLHQEDIVPSQDTVRPFPEIQSIPHVIISDIRAASVGAVVAFVRLVGQGIRHLSVSSVRYPTTTTTVDWKDLCCEILKACPVLESLEFHSCKMKLSTLRCVLDGFASGLCRLQRLMLECDHLIAENLSLKPLFDALVNSHHPARYHLREISLSRLPFGTMVRPSVIPSCVAMLKENNVLQRLELRFVVRTIHNTQYRDCVAQLTPFDNERIVGKPDPHVILAFLSVIAADRGQATAMAPRAMQQLDANVLSVILALATPVYMRRVTIV